MKSKIAFPIILGLFFFSLLNRGISTEPESHQSKNKSFVVVIASYNNKKWYEKNLDSVFKQTYPQFRVIYIDDASKDKTGDYVQKYIEKNQLENRITLIRNEKNQGALANKYMGAHLCKPNEIIVDLDGDDWFAHYEVLSFLNAVYSDPQVWLTYGEFIRYPSYYYNTCGQVPPDVIANNSFRSYPHGTTPLRTFYAGLFQKIKKEDLLYNGEFFSTASDLAFMFPMLEMAGKHIKFVPTPLYVYNNSTAIHDHVARPEHQLQMDRYIRSRPRYTPLSDLNHEDINF